MHTTVGGYVAGAFLVSLIGRGVTAVSMLLLGVPYFLALGLGNGKDGVPRVPLAPEDQGPRERPPTEPPVLHH
jgi:hypothetical protein